MIRKMIIRLDDCCSYRHVEKWDRIEMILDSYQIKPIVGIIPDCKDRELMKFGKEDDELYWDRIKKWQEKGWIVGLHGYQHIFHSKSGGINPVNLYSEFASRSYKEQADAIRRGYNILTQHQIKPVVFFAPAHTFDDNTLLAVREETPIRIISDTVSFDKYSDGYFTYYPVQSGKVRNLPFKTVTFCYHPNLLEEKDFRNLEKFLKKHRQKFECSIEIVSRKFNIIDYIIRYVYFGRRKIK